MRRPEKLDKYEVLEELGRGGFGVVYKVRHPKLKVFRAIKLLHAVGDAEQVREAVLQAGLEHERIVNVLDVGEYQGRPFWVMELLEGGGLDRLVSKGPLPGERALRIGRDLALALDAAHKKGVVHRDLKPANVLLNSEGRAKVTDFGLARIMEEGQSHHSRMAGTVSYLAPEQLHGQATPKSDLWSLGCVLFEMLTGKRPFEMTSDFDTMRAIADSAAPDLSLLLPQAPRDLPLLIRRLLSKEPEQRPESAADVAQSLSRIMEQPWNKGTKADQPGNTLVIDDWSMFRGDASRSGALSPGLRYPLKEVWRFKAEAPITASPAICRGRVFIGDTAGVLMALDLMSGGLLWRYRGQGAAYPSPSAVGTAVLFCTVEGEVYALQAATGRLVWQSSLEAQVSASPLLSEHGVFVGNMAGELCRLDPVDGHLLKKWPGTGAVEASPLLVMDQVFWLTSTGLIQALDVVQDEVIWQKELGQGAEASPAYYGGKLFTLCRDGLAACLDAVSGESIWRTELGELSVATPVVDQTGLWCVTMSGEVICLDPGNGQEIWRSKARAAVSASPALDNTYLVVADRSGGLNLFKRQDGGLVHRWEMASPVSASPAIWREVLISGDLAGNITAWAS
jgi:outer membrane protein assembly factor BamB/tRNA A-37 threonylcarbamoyl transferase component Bud32